MTELTKPRNNPALRRLIKQHDLISYSELSRSMNKSLGCIRDRTAKWNVEVIKHSSTLFVKRVDAEFLSYTYVLPFNTLSVDTGLKIIELYRADPSISRYAIAECCGVHLSTVYRVIAEYIECDALILSSKLNYVIE